MLRSKNRVKKNLFSSESAILNGTPSAKDLSRGEDEMGESGGKNDKGKKEQKKKPKLTQKEKKKLKNEKKQTV